MIAPPPSPPTLLTDELSLRKIRRVGVVSRVQIGVPKKVVGLACQVFTPGNQTRVMTLDAVEFIRRFLLHILPTGLVRIRQFGFLANRARGNKLALCRALLGAPTAPPSHTVEPRERANRVSYRHASIWANADGVAVGDERLLLRGLVPD